MQRCHDHPALMSESQRDEVGLPPKSTATRAWRWPSSMHLQVVHGAVMWRKGLLLMLAMQQLVVAVVVVVASWRSGYHSRHCCHRARRNTSSTCTSSSKSTSDGRSTIPCSHPPAQ